MPPSSGTSLCSDDWTRMESTADRRKTQNRMAQRKYRDQMKRRRQRPSQFRESTPELNVMPQPLEQASQDLNWELGGYYPSSTEDGIATFVSPYTGDLSSASSRVATNPVPGDPTHTRSLPLVADVGEFESWDVGEFHDSGISMTQDHCEHGRGTYSDLDPSVKIICRREACTGDTPLHHAVRFGRTDVVQLLIARGANSNIGNDEGQTALHLAAERGDQTMVRSLLEAGACSETYDNFGAVALHLAAAYGHTATVALLLDMGADADQASGQQLA